MSFPTQCQPRMGFSLGVLDRQHSGSCGGYVYIRESPSNAKSWTAVLNCHHVVQSDSQDAILPSATECIIKRNNQTTYRSMPCYSSSKTLEGYHVRIGRARCSD